MTRLPIKQPRTCGDCAACCSALPITELSKPAHHPCAHLSMTRGCGIYTARPPSCCGFECSWLQGHLSGSQRPDRLGVIVYAQNARIGLGEEQPIIHLAEVQDGALDKAEVKQILRDAIARYEVCVELPVRGEKRATVRRASP